MLSANITKWSNTLKHAQTRLSVFDHFVVLALKVLSLPPCCTDTGFLGTLHGQEFHRHNRVMFQ